MKLAEATTVVRDVAIWAVGVYGIVHEELTGTVHLELLALYMAILAIPGSAGLVTLLKRGALAGPASPSPSVEPPSLGPRSPGQSDE